MRFSVIIPLYNKAPYVQKALDSVFKQTFSDFDLIVVDDGSRDESLNVAQEALQAAPIGHLLIHQDNAGVSIARNNGVAASHGDYLCFLDADDWWEPTYLEELDIMIKDFPDAGLYGTSYTIVNNKNHKTRVASIGVEENFERGYINYFQVYSDGLHMPIWTGAACVPRGVFQTVRGFNPDLRMGEDFDLWVRIALNQKVAFLNKSLSNYNQDVILSNRALGSLPSPKAQFAFQADYLMEAKEDNPAIKFTVEMVQITCLRNYYLSKAYHERAKKILYSMDINAHRSRTYAKYLFYPFFWVLMKDRLLRFLRQWIAR